MHKRLWLILILIIVSVIVLFGCWKRTGNLKPEPSEHFYPQPSEYFYPLQPEPEQVPFPMSFHPQLWGDLSANRDVVANTNQTQEIPLPDGDQYSYHIDKRGFRGEEQHVSDDTWKALLVGDGEAFAVGLDGNKDVASQLALILREYYPHRSLAVFNGGMPGYTISDMLDYLREKGKMMRPDLVIVTVTEDDVWEIARPVLVREEYKKAANNPDYFKIFHQKRFRYGLFRFREPYLRKTGISEEEALNKLVPRYMKLAISLRDEVAQWKGRTLFIVRHPGLPQEAGFKKSELDYLVVPQPQHISGRLPDGHWPADMCSFVAGYIGEWIRETKILE